MATATKKEKTGDVTLGTGRRKTSVARVRLRAGSGKITVNNRSLDEFFCNEQQQKSVVAPLLQTGKAESVDIIIRVHGGGITGQAGACLLGIARALKNLDEGLDDALRDGGFLTRDSRMRERKKYGLHGARRGTQFSKR